MGVIGGQGGEKQPFGEEEASRAAAGASCDDWSEAKQGGVAALNGTKPRSGRAKTHKADTGLTQRLDRDSTRKRISPRSQQSTEAR